MVDLSVKIGDITLQNPIQPASGAFSWEYNDVIDLNRLGALVAKTICRELHACIYDDALQIRIATPGPFAPIAHVALDLPAHLGGHPKAA